jgi:hypothetical protein
MPWRRRRKISLIRGYVSANLYDITTHIKAIILWFPTADCRLQTQGSWYGISGGKRYTDTDLHLINWGSSCKYISDKTSHSYPLTTLYYKI